MDPTAGLRHAFATTSFVARKILRHWPWIVAGFAVVFGSAVGYALARPDTYRSEVLVQVAPAILTDFVPGAEPSAEDLERRIHQLTLSRTRLTRVLVELRPWAGRSDGEESVDAQLRRLRDRIAIEMHGEDTFLLAFEHEDAAMAQAVTRRLAALFIEDRAAARTSRAASTVRVLGEQVALLLSDLGRREDALATFKEEHRAELAALRRPGGAADVAPRPLPVDLGAELRARRAALVAELQAIRAASQTSPEAEALRAQIAEARRERASLLERFTRDYPTVIENTRRLATLERELADALARTARAPAGARALELAQRIADLDAEISRVERSAKRPSRPAPPPPTTPRLTFAEVEAQLDHLDAELATARDKHRQTATRLMDAELALSVESRSANEGVKVIDPANRPSRPVGPARAKILALGLLLGLLLGLALAFAAGALDTRIFEEMDLARAVDPALVLVTIPEFRRPA